MSEFTVRAYRPEDRPVVRDICFDTGLMGESIASQYADRESFADMFTAYFTDHEPENFWVAETEGRIVGYVCAALDMRKAHSSLRYAFKHALLRGACFRPGTAGFYFRSCLDVVSDVGSNKMPKIDLDRFPSQNHINLLPEARGGGVAVELFFTLIDGLKERGSVGMHAETLASNRVVAEFIQRKLGGKKFGDPYPLPGLRGKQGERLEAQAFTLDLTNWVPGAWRKPKRSEQSSKPAGR